MSPASQGGLELKRYIGSCLISAPALRKTGGGCRGAAAAEGGAALVAGPAPAPLCGLPLISLAARPGAFSRLAMHTQGAPLILAGRYGARKQGQGQGQRQQQQPQQRGQGAAQPQTAARRRAPALAPAVARAAEGATEAAAAGGAGGGRATSSDSLNTASDESSGPSENSLPRIIKPRKRRKKDRKPPPAPAASQPAAPPSPEAAAPEGSSIVTLRPYVPLCFELYDGARPPPAAAAAAAATATASTRRAAEPKRSEPPRSKPRPQLQAQAARSGDGEAAPQLQLRPPAPSASPSPSVCQCRYCDPRGHIWDVHRHCYSPVLTAPAPDESPFASIPLFLSAPPAGHAADTDDGFFSDDLPTSASPFSLSGDAEDSPADGGSGSALRRSWSGCSSSSSSSFSSSSSSSSSPPSLAADPGGRAHTAAVAVASQGLQVSTEIVTSPNGHRDLEIRFYSSSPPGRQAASDARVRTEAAWPASRPGGGGLWRSGQADEHGAAALGDEVLQLSIRAEE